MKAALQLQSMAYDGAPVLGALSFGVEAAETLAITGPSGIGKSTILRIMAGLETRFDGSVVMPERVGFVFQEPVLMPWRSAMENIILTTDVSQDTAEQALADVGLAGLGARRPDQLSLGQQRRLALARAFALQPEILLMDEPFVSLDADLASEIMGLFERLRAKTGVATILVTHAPEEAARLATRIIRLGGSPAEIISESQNSGAYFQESASGVTSSGS